MRVLVLVISLAWMGASWWWYVCQIKDYCGATATVAKKDTAKSVNSNVETAKSPEKKQDTDSVDVGSQIQSLVISASEQTKKPAKSGDKSSSESSKETSVENSKTDANNDVTNKSEDKQEDAKQEQSDQATAASQENATNPTLESSQKVEEDINKALDTSEEAASTEIKPTPVEESADADDPTKIRIDRVKDQSANNSSVQGVRIYFPYNSSKQADLTGSASSYFDELVQVLEADSSIELLLTGHTDNQGAANRNKTLGKRRADTVKEILVKKGIPSARIKTASEGEDKPLWSNKSKVGRDKNRRVELIGVKKAAE